MSDFEYTILCAIVGIGYLFIIGGVPLVTLIMRPLLPIIPRYAYYATSVLSIYVLLLMWHLYVEAKIDDSRPPAPASDDQVDTDTNEGSVILLLGIPCGIASTSFVFFMFNDSKPLPISKSKTNGTV